MKNYYDISQMLAGNVKELYIQCICILYIYIYSYIYVLYIVDTYSIVTTFRKLCEWHGSRAFCVTYCSKVAC